MRTAAALIIGNELLSGKIEDKNLVVLARTLRGLGIRLDRVVMILDDPAVIEREVRALSEAHDWLFTSGGVGPTHDDVTVEAVGRAFGKGLVMQPQMEQMLRAYYGDRITDGHLLMARVPEGARLITAETTPWPAVLMRNVWVLPGVPQIFQMKMALVQRELAGDAPFVSLAVLTDLDEGELKPKLDAIVAAYGDVDVGSYPRFGDAAYRTKLTFDGTAEERVRSARDAFVASLPASSILGLE